MRSQSVLKMTTAALLIAVGIAIPTFSPFKIVIEPASFTLGSHVAIFIAMFVSPFIGISVAVGTTLGFLLGGFPPVVVWRAASHLFFVAVGSMYIKKRPQTLASPLKARIFSFAIGLIHAAGEVAVASTFYFSDSFSQAYYEQGYMQSVMLLVGVGTVIHSMVDFEIALFISKVLDKNKLMPRFS